ncbi:MAG: glutathione S-transferase family protein [Pseudomonadales bacterium]
MITLHGFAASNFYNAVKHVLLYKQIPFEENEVFGGGEEWLAISPVGKVPAITTADGQYLSESSVICHYLEEVYPDIPLYPQDPAARGRVRQIMKIAELYLEGPARRLVGYHFSGKPAPEPLKGEVRHVIKRGIGGMQRLCEFSPWIAGEKFSMADIYVHYINAVVGQIGSRELEWDILAEMPGLREWRELMKDSDIARQVEQERAANIPKFQAYIKEYMSSSK